MAVRLIPEPSPFPRLLAFPLFALVVMFAALARTNAELLLRSAHCALRETTGLRCPTCGGTLAAIRLAEGRPAEALAANPLVTLSAFAGGLWCLYAVTATFLPRLRRAVAMDPGAAKTARWLAAVVLLLIWTYEIVAR